MFDRVGPGMVVGPASPVGMDSTYPKREAEMYTILQKQVLSDVTKLVVVAAPHVARKAKAGQFVIVIVDEQGERIPLTIADSDAQAGTIALIFQEVGKSTMQMGLLEVGEGFHSIA